jgi:hypothetical protein
MDEIEAPVEELVTLLNDLAPVIQPAIFPSSLGLKEGVAGLCKTTKHRAQLETLLSTLRAEQSNWESLVLVCIAFTISTADSNLFHLYFAVPHLLFARPRVLTIQVAQWF